ncbi:MAG: UDP-N-acetylglucosamine 1-carboxyvinyltransferase [bacterium]
MSNEYFLVKQSLNLNGTVNLSGAKNAVLVIMASLLLTNGKSEISNVPDSADVAQMIKLLQSLGADVFFDESKNFLTVDTTNVNKFEVCPEIMNKMRASILVMGPLLSRFKKATVALPGGCLIGARPIDIHLKNFEKLGVKFLQENHFLQASFLGNEKKENKIILEYPSVGATENLIMLAILNDGQTTIVNASFEPEVLDLIEVLKKMGADIDICVPATLKISGVNKLNPIKHKVIPDRLEAGSLLLAAAVSGGQIYLPDANVNHLDVFLEKLREMGHEIEEDENKGIKFTATKNPQAVNFKTCPYPGFPTDLQAPMMTALCFADGVSVVEETVFENRLLHVKELNKLGAQITVEGNKATIRKVDEFYGTEVIATDIRAGCALLIAGLVANGETKITGVQHLKRGYDKLEKKLNTLGADITLILQS